jgi:hypothetical protein
MYRKALVLAFIMDAIGSTLLKVGFHLSESASLGILLILLSITSMLFAVCSQLEAVKIYLAIRR